MDGTKTTTIGLYCPACEMPNPARDALFALWAWVQDDEDIPVDLAEQVRRVLADAARVVSPER